jgi:hypothetical protein
MFVKLQTNDSMKICDACHLQPSKAYSVVAHSVHSSNSRCAELWLLLFAVFTLRLIHNETCYLVTCRNGATQWYFPGASFNKGDVTLQKLDVTAGSAVIHFMDYNIFSEPQRTFWNQQAKNMGCGEGGGPAAATATKGVEQQQPQQQSINAGMIAGATVPDAAWVEVCDGMTDSTMLNPSRVVCVCTRLRGCVGCSSSATGQH